MDNMLMLLAFFWSGAILMVLGVVTGGILVLVTKREAHELSALLRRPTNSPQDAINIDDMFGNVGGEEDVEEDVVPNLFAAKNAEFLSQVAEEARK